MPEQQGDPTLKQGDNNEPDVDVDTEMVDTQDGSANRAAHNEAAMDPSSQSETQPATATATASSLLQQNRKDVTLREFLSKMDDYAPIVCVRPFALERALQFFPCSVSRARQVY